MDNSQKKYVSGILSGVVSVCFLHPFDAIRIRLFWGKNNGHLMKSLFNGFSFNMISTCFKNVATYPTQELFRDTMIKHGYSQYQSELAASFGSGVFLGIVATPINAIKTPMQGHNNYKFLNVVRDIYSKFGLAGFYRGGMATVMRDTTWNTLYFPTYKYVNENHIENKFGASILSSVICLTFTYPLDGIRLYRQNNKENFRFWDGFKHSFNPSMNNLKSYLMCVTRVPLGVAITHMTYLYANDYLK